MQLIFLFELSPIQLLVSSLWAIVDAQLETNEIIRTFSETILNY